MAWCLTAQSRYLDHCWPRSMSPAGPRLNIKIVFPGMGIHMLKIRRPVGRLIFNMGIAIPSKTVFLIETAPWSKCAYSICCSNVTSRHSCRTSLFLLIWLPKAIQTYHWWKPQFKVPDTKPFSNPYFSSLNTMEWYSVLMQCLNPAGHCNL